MWRTNDHTGREACYFITFNTVDWVDVFIRPVYKQVVVHSLNHFIESRGLIVYSWCLMTNHLYLLAQAEEGYDIAHIENSFCDFTTQKILEAIETEPETRKEWMMKHFERSGSYTTPGKDYRVWQNAGNRMIDMTDPSRLVEFFEYIHESPVRDRFVDVAADYPYSSARDYAGMPGLVNTIKVPIVEQLLAASESFKSSFFVKHIRN